MIGRVGRRDVLGAFAAASLAACGRGGGEDGGGRPGPPRVVFKHQPLWGDAAPFRELLSAFEREAGVPVVAEALPNESDLVHQYFLTALEAGSRDFDVFVADVVWVAELARAGWVADLSGAFPPEVIRRDFLAGAAESAIFEGRTWAVPWYVDVGVLYRRADVVPAAPTTFAELEEAALAARRAGRTARGYVWQGRQYEGLVCNVYEAIWGHGGEAMAGGRVLLDTPEARAALGWLRGLIMSGASPRAVTSHAEEEARRVFQDGGAALMRNWPYAYAEAQREGSRVRGEVAISPLPTLSGAAGHGALGGYLLAVNARSPADRREDALRFVAHLTSHEASVALACSYGRAPARRAPYLDPRAASGAPLLTTLLPMVERARPRPVTPYYPMISDVLQGEFSAAVAGIRSPEDALARAQALVDRLTGAGS